MRSSVMGLALVFAVAVAASAQTLQGTPSPGNGGYLVFFGNDDDGTYSGGFIADGQPPNVDLAYAASQSATSVYVMTSVGSITVGAASYSGGSWSATVGTISGGGGDDPGGGEEVLIEDIGLDAPGFLLAVATNFGVVVSACLSLSFGLLVINKGVRWYASTIRKA